jgi:hypothetical protein
MITKAEVLDTLKELGVPVYNNRVKKQDLAKALGSRGTDKVRDLYPKPEKTDPGRDRYVHKDPKQCDEVQLLKRAKLLFNVLTTKLGGKPFGRSFEPLELKDKKPSDIAKDLADSIKELESRKLSNQGFENIVKDLKRRSVKLKFLTDNLEPGDAAKAA